MSAGSQLLAEVSKDSILQLIPGLHAVALEHGAIRAFAAGQEVARRGAPTSHLIIPLSGPLRLVADGPAGTLERRRALALRELIEGKPLPYSAIADQQTSVLFVDARRVLDVLYKRPDVVHYLRLITRSAGLRSFRTFLLERGLDHEAIFAIVAKIPLVPLDLAAGAELPREPALFFVRAGKLELTRRGEGRAVALGEGAFFGGQALIPPRTVDYSAKILERCSIHAAPAAQLAPLLERHNLLDALYEEPYLTPQLDGEADGGVLTPLPGRALTAEELGGLGVRVDPTKLLTARSDRESVAASLVNVAAVLGLRTNPARIEAGITMRKRITPLSLAEELEAFGLSITGTKIEGGRPSPGDAPALLWLGPRLVVLLGADERGASLLDPARGGVLLTHAELAGLWDGALLRVERQRSEAPPSEEPEAKRRGRAIVFELLAEHRGALSNIAALVLLHLTLKLLGPLFTAYIFDDVLAIGRFDLTVGLAAGLALVTTLGALTSLGQQYLFNRLSVRFDADLSERFYQAALALPMGFYQRRRVGDVITRLQEIGTIRDFMSGQTIAAGLNLATLVVSALVLFAFSPAVALAALGMVALLVLVQLATRPIIRRLHRRVFDANRRATSLIAEMFAAVTTVKAANAEPVLRGRWEQAFLDGVRQGRELELRVNTSQAIINAVSSVGATGVLWFACAAALEGKLSVGAILAVTMYLSNMIRPTLTLSSLISAYEETKVAFDKLEEVFEAEPEESPSSALVTHSARLRGKIRLERVSFRYSREDPLVLKEVSLTLYPGQVVAIVGRSGSGKTTLANVIAGYTKPSSGRVFLDHYDASMLSKACLRRQIGYVQQSYSLFGGTIGSNVAYADDAPDASELDRAALDAHCQEFIARFGSGYDYKLAPRGVGLSGGQRQRLAIARVLYQGPQILVMDEALSALDADSEAAINDNMRRITEGKTTIIIAHRVSTVRQADRIVVVHNGEIVEDGDHRALMSKGGFYAELFEGQFDAEDEEARAS